MADGNVSTGGIDPEKAWNHIWNIDHTLRSWAALSPEEQKRWKQYVTSGRYEEARKKADDYDD